MDVHNNSVIEYFLKLDTLRFEGINNKLQEIINNNSISFEGRKFPYTLKPMLLSETDTEYFKKACEVLSEVIEIALNAYYCDQYVRDFFNHYDDYKVLIDIVRPADRKVTLSRFDTVWFGGNSFKIFEANTCCPGGVATLGTIKNSYLEIAEIKQLLKHFEVQKYLCDSPENFISCLIDSYLCQIDSNALEINIAFANYDGNYTYELNDLKKCAINMGMKAFICDLKDLSLVGNELQYQNTTIHIVYNKVDQLALDINKIEDFIKAINQGCVLSVNSFSAMFIGESKMILALMHDKYFQNNYLNKEQIEMVSCHVPWTSKLYDNDNNNFNVIEHSKKNKDTLVLKIDNETRGSNVFIGIDMLQEDWDCKIDFCKNRNWLVQEYFEIPTTPIPEIKEGKVVLINKKFGLDMFMYSGKFAGIVSRVSDRKILNVASGGYEQPIITIKDTSQVNSI